jgi:hypothetical protein
MKKEPSINQKLFIILLMMIVGTYAGRITGYK